VHPNPCYGCAGIVGVLLYSWGIHRFLGPRCTRPGPVVAPDQLGLSPAQCRYIYRSGRVWVDLGLLYVALVSMAVKGALRIQESKEEFEISRTDAAPNPPLSEEEAIYLQELLGDQGRILLRQCAHFNLFKRVHARVFSTVRRKCGSYLSPYRNLPYLGILLALASAYFMFTSDPETSLEILAAALAPLIITIMVAECIRLSLRALFQTSMFRSRYLRRRSAAILILIVIALLALDIGLFAVRLLPPAFWVYILAVTGLYVVVKNVCLRVRMPSRDRMAAFCALDNYSRQLYTASHVSAHSLRRVALGDVHC